MNTAVRTLSTSSQSFGIHISWYALWHHHKWTLMLSLAVLLSAFLTIYITDTNRQLTNQLQNAQEENVSLHNGWTQLLLQKSRLADQAHIAQIAHEKLGMIIPKSRDVVNI